LLGKVSFEPAVTYDKQVHANSAFIFSPFF
jgi:hypothetical protein